MALENIGVVEAWSRLLRMMQKEKAAYAGYIGLKIYLPTLFLVVMIRMRRPRPL